MAAGEGKVGLAVGASERIFGDKCSEEANVIEASFIGKSVEPLLGSAAGASSQIPNCPNCKVEPKKVYRNGHRYLKDGTSVQRCICKKCDQGFTEKPLQTISTGSINIPKSIPITRQICAEGAKNLHAPKHKHLGSRELTDEEKAPLKVFEGYLEKEGYRHTRYHQLIGTLLYLDADINNPEDVKSKIGAHPVGGGAKVQFLYAYEAFMAMKNSLDKTQKMTWDRPKYKQEEKNTFHSRRA